MTPPLVRDRVAVLVAASGMKPKALSALCGLSPSHIGMILRGKVSDPGIRTLRVIAGVTTASLSWLTLGEGTAPSPDAVREAVERARGHAVGTLPVSSVASRAA